MKIYTSYLSYHPKGISFMDDKSFKKILKTEQRVSNSSFWTTILIIDEYDDLLFDYGKPHSLAERFFSFAKFNKIIGFGGSYLSKIENQCITKVFGTEKIIFPHLNQNYNPSLTIHQSIIFQNQNEWLQCISQKVTPLIKQVPLLLAVQENDIKILKKQFIKNEIPFFDLTELVAPNKVSQLQTLLDCQFCFKVNKGQYGVYIISTALGRGTDFPTSSDIENNGGIFLLICDVFESRIIQQIKGRVCRMQNKGQIQEILYTKSSTNTVNYYQMRQNVLGMNNDQQKENLFKIITEKQGFMEEATNNEENQKLRSLVFQ